MSLTPEERRLRARLAVHERHHPDSPYTAELRRMLADSRRRHRLIELLREAPPLPQEQIDRVVALLPPVRTSPDDIEGGDAA